MQAAVDPIPDFISGVGLLDEMVVVPIGVLIAAKMIPVRSWKSLRRRPEKWRKARSP